MQATRILFEQIKEGKFRAFTSPVTVREISVAPRPVRDKLLALIKDYGVEVSTVDEEEVEFLMKRYMEQHIVPEEFEDDARHVAHATILKVDILVSLNLGHIVNEWSARKFNAVNLEEGYGILVIRSPEEAVYYGD